jgi:cell division protein FtsL
MARAAPAAAPRRAPAKKSPTTRAQRNARAIANARTAQRAAAVPATRTAPARTAPARRKSGPAAKPATRKRTAAPATSPVARVLNSRGMPLVDRVLRGPGWVVMLGALLAGIVFLNVSVLELNRGIARTDAKSAELERTNSGLRARVAKLDSGERIQALAEARGFVMPQPGDVNYVRERGANVRLALQRISPPAPAPTAATTTPTTTTPTGTTPTTTTAPAATATPTMAPTAAVAPATTTPTTTVP